MAYDIIAITLSGNLTEDAVKTVFSEKEKAVINFTLAVNINKDKTEFLNCNYWVNTKNSNTQEDPEKDIVEYFLNKLKKGNKITIFSEYFSMNKSTNQEQTMTYHNLNITVSKFV